MATSLARAPIGIELRVIGAVGPTALTRRLSELGLRVGSHVRCVQRTAGGGRIVDVAGSRIALGRDVLDSVQAVEAHPVEATTA
ncbi:MAG TPA: FeoA family protein [Ornithinibacter sp.]|nr:FeoA family protein [Ornithinibacter sp.]